MVAAINRHNGPEIVLIKIYRQFRLLFIEAITVRDSLFGAKLMRT